MNPSPEFWVATIGQTVIIVSAVIAAFVRTERRMVRLETKVEHVESVQQDRAHDAERLDDKVDGMSTSLAVLEGAHRACPYWSMGPTPPRPKPQS